MKKDNDSTKLKNKLTNVFELQPGSHVVAIVEV